MICLTNFQLCSNVQELRDIAMTDAVKGKHFFLESDIKGPALKLDNTGKAILTVSVSPSTGINWNKMICSINWIVTIIYTCFMFNPGDGEMFSVDFHFYFRDSKSRRDSCWELTPVLLHSRVLHPLLQNLKYK